MLCLSCVLMLLVSQVGQAASFQETRMEKVQTHVTAAGDSSGRGKPMFSAGYQSMNLDFGGEKHGKDNEGDNLRPEAVLTKVCDDSLKCNECTSKTSCWHGADDGKLQLDVPANSAHNIFSAEVWASCATEKGVWRVITWKNRLQNGFLNIYLDGKLFKKVENKKFVQYNKIPVVKDSRVTVEFHRIDTGSAASGYITMKADAIDAHVDSCMGSQLCLAGLGDGSESAFLFRTSNKLQLRCLSAATAAQRSDASDHCEQFVTCLSAHPPRKENLEALLKASVGTSGLLVENSKSSHRRDRSGGRHDQVDAAEVCVDPSDADPESWDCECMEEWTATCGGDEDCFKEILCGNTNVCASWKTDQCSASLIAKQNNTIKASKEKHVALMRRSVQRVVAVADDHLESALSGKCSQ